MKKPQQKSLDKQTATPTIKQAQKDLTSQRVSNETKKVQGQTVKIDKNNKTSEKNIEKQNLENKKQTSILKTLTQKQISTTKLQSKIKPQQNQKSSSTQKLNQSLNKSIELSQSKPKDQNQKLIHSIKKQTIPNKIKIQQGKPLKQTIKKDLKQVIDSKASPSNLNKIKSEKSLQISAQKKDQKKKVQNPSALQKLKTKDAIDMQKQIPQKQKKEQNNKNPSKSLTIQSPQKLKSQDNLIKDQKSKMNENPTKFQTKQKSPSEKLKEIPTKDIKSDKNQSLSKIFNKDSKQGVIKSNQNPKKEQKAQKIPEKLSKGIGVKIVGNEKNQIEIKTMQKNQKVQSIGKIQREKPSKSPLAPQRIIESAPQSPRVKQIKYSPEDIARIRFLKRLKKEKESIEQRIEKQRQLEEMEYERIKQEKQQQLFRQQSKQKAEKLRKIESRLQEIERRKQQRKHQISERNKEYLQKKTEFTLEHKIINQWLEKQLEENKINEKKLEEKISKMKPINYLQSIKDHMELIDSYKQMHQSRFREEDLKFQRSKSRIEIEKMYKSNWYKQIQENDPLETYKLEEEKKREQKQLLLMKLDNKKKYAEYVKANHKPQNTEQSVFKYEKPIINSFTADQIKKMGLDNLSYCKEQAQKHQRKDSKAALSEHNEPRKHKDYLHELKNERKKRENFGSEEDFDQLVQNIKSSTSLTKEQKIKRITHLAEKMQRKAQNKEQLFNLTNNSRLKILQNKQKDFSIVTRKSSLPLLKQRSVSQPKLKINDSHKILLKQKIKDKDEDFMKEIDEKLILLKKI